EAISTIFKEIGGNKMISSFDLLDVIDLISKIDFNDSEDTHVLSQIYEELLLKLGKEGGISGEFYTPRPIVKFMVEIVQPVIGEKIFDPFCGSAGFIIESYKSMINSKEPTVDEYEYLQKTSFYGHEKKPLPYLLGLMNSILHGLLAPQIKRKNTLSENVRNIPEIDRYDVILTNPPFGGTENERIQQNFPIPIQATEILALQYVMKHMKRKSRCGMVVPEGVLFRKDAFSKVKRELIENFNLHTIISLPYGIFANVTAQGSGPKTNLIFFEKPGRTKEVWYYELTLKRNLSKTNPIRYEEMTECIDKWKNRKISENSWIVDVDEIVRRDYDLAAKNPNRKNVLEQKSLEFFVADIIEKENEIISIMQEIQSMVEKNNE
ncbi:MAG TPA: N-6 DNA methylase, partial [Nitrososphaeraceae archaeon]|nr:N-6 DNA methylase [Nitrososphaeraceae archaeon]